MTDRLAYRVAEAARLLGVSERTVRRLVASGQLRAVTVGGIVLVPRAELDRLLEGDPASQAGPIPREARELAAKALTLAR